MVECKVCNVSHVRVRGKLRTDKRGYMFVDATGRQWSGQACPDCRNSGLTGGSDKYGIGPSEVLYPPKLRACRSCNVMNPNYYECNDCRSVKAQHGCYDEDMFQVYA